jgi:hypothetical protein
MGLRIGVYPVIRLSGYQGIMMTGLELGVGFRYDGRYLKVQRNPINPIGRKMMRKIVQKNFDKRDRKSTDNLPA